VLEHVQNLEDLLREFHRILAPNGRLEVTVPHFSNTLAYSDYTHKRFFGLYTFDYFAPNGSRFWPVPRYTKAFSYRIEERRLVFRNFSILGRPLEWIFNRTELASYVYESKLSWFLPCFEIIFTLAAEGPTDHRGEPE
jgi:hypothetical protein